MFQVDDDARFLPELLGNQSLSERAWPL